MPCESAALGVSTERMELVTSSRDTDMPCPGAAWAMTSFSTMVWSA